MNLKEFLKSNKTIRWLGKKINTDIQYSQDAADFSKYYAGSAENKNDYRYSIMMLVHSLEKGMCHTDPRPFGRKSVLELIKFLENYPSEQTGDFEYQLGLSVLNAWLDFYITRGWETEEPFADVSVFMNGKGLPSTIKAGSKEYAPVLMGFDDAVLERLFLSRHSVRDYQNKKINQDDLEFALKCFVETPTACNRQMCRIYYISNPEISTLLKNTVIGISGFNKETVQFFVITYDLASLTYSGERQQGFFNAGLCTMNFLNGLHVKGIGSCCLQWSNKYNEDKMVREKLKLRESERIAVIVGAGYYLEHNIIPSSVRRDISDVYSVI